MSKRKYEFHGMTGTPTYRAWKAMKSRCYSKSHPLYKRYGARGITVCEEWRNSFSSFLKDMGVRADGLSIDRINNDGNYEPSNCRWATVREQNWNKRGIKMITFNGESQPIQVWERKLGLGIGTLRRRIIKGMGEIEALTVPVGGRE